VAVGGVMEMAKGGGQVVVRVLEETWKQTVVCLWLAWQSIFPPAKVGLGWNF